MSALLTSLPRKNRFVAEVEERAAKTPGSAAILSQLIEKAEERRRKAGVSHSVHLSNSQVQKNLIAIGGTRWCKHGYNRVDLTVADLILASGGGHGVYGVDSATGKNLVGLYYCTKTGDRRPVPESWFVQGWRGFAFDVNTRTWRTRAPGLNTGMVIALEWVMVALTNKTMW